MKKINVKKLARTTEHAVIIVAVVGAVGFYLGNSYGHSHIDLKSLKTTQNAPQTTSK